MVTREGTSVKGHYKKESLIMILKARRRKLAVDTQAQGATPVIQSDKNICLLNRMVQVQVLAGVQQTKNNKKNKVEILKLFFRNIQV